MKVKIVPYTLHFKRPAGTSRGVYTTRKVWYVWMKDPDTGRCGVGECAPLPALSCDDLPDYEVILQDFCRRFEQSGRIDHEAMRSYPSMLFGMESALLHVAAKSVTLVDTPFTRGESGIPINGLIWMGDFDEMYSRIEEKMKMGFRCIKVKIGAIGFDEEVRLLEHIRNRFGRDQVELRVDANGAFAPEDAFEKLEMLSRYDIHSIEQPVRAGQWEVMARLCGTSPLPIALDEELIGINRREEKIRLLEKIRPASIVIKPSLHGGLYGAEEWVALAEERGIGWWVTSALESNIGLNVISQWCSTLHPEIPQGLGTGSLFTDNTDYPLYVKEDCLWYDPDRADQVDFRKIS